MSLIVRFPSEQNIIASLEQHPLTNKDKDTNHYLSEHKIIQAMARYFANKELAPRGIQMGVSITMSDLNQKLKVLNPNSIYNEAMNLEFDVEKSETAAFEAFKQAAKQSYLPAVLELTHKEWKSNVNSYGYAVQLRPYIGKGDKELDFHFGRALKNGCQIGSQNYYEGLYWMQKSRRFTAKYPEKDQSFESFISHYIHRNRESMLCDYDRFRYIGDSVVLAPSKMAWTSFKLKLQRADIAPLESFMFEYNKEKIKSIMKEFKIGTIASSKFVPIEGCGGDGKRIDTLSIYENLTKKGEISVQRNLLKDTFEITQTFSDPKIQPVIEFIENVMERSGSAASAYAWLQQINP